MSHHLVFPEVHSEVFHTPNGTPYLRQAGIVVIGQPVVDLSGMQQFFDGFDEELGFGAYLNDPDELQDATQLVKIAGQACYASFGKKRSKNAKAQEYIDHLKESGHGSVLEHPNFTLFIYGISRSLTHEFVRHRAGYGYSQLSQRYVDGKVLRFIERPEFARYPTLHARFEERIDLTVREYEKVAAELMQFQGEGGEILSGERRTDLRKKVNQCARAVLPNETETWMIVTGNVRAWRHFLESRANPGAEVEIRATAMRVFKCLQEANQELFSDYEIVNLEDGTQALQTPWRKV